MQKHNLALLTLAFLFTQSDLAQCHGSNQDYWKADEYYQNSSSQKNAAADLMKFVTIQNDWKILDVGCGDGKITAEIGAKACQGTVVGVDTSPAMIEFAQTTFSSQDFPNLQFYLKDAQNLDYNNDFDAIFSFTTLQWVQSHNAFLEGAYASLKPHGVLAVTMPMGLPLTLEQAVTELISTPEWSSYFADFSTGWNFISDKEYGLLLSSNRFVSDRLAIVPQRDIFPNRDVFEKFVGQWFPYLRPLPEDLKKTFLTKVVDRFLELETQFPNGEVHFKIRRLEVIATKS